MTKRDRYLRRVYGLTEKQYLRMFTMQGGTCWICQRYPKPGKHLHVDHVHAKKKKDRIVRGLLCWTCNSRLLGRGRENPALHRRAAEYLERGFDGRMLHSSSISSAPTEAPCVPSVTDTKAKRKYITLTEFPDSLLGAYDAGILCGEAEMLARAFRAMTTLKGRK